MPIKRKKKGNEHSIFFWWWTLIHIHLNKKQFFAFHFMIICGVHSIYWSTITKNYVSLRIAQYNFNTLNAEREKKTILFVYILGKLNITHGKAIHIFTTHSIDPLYKIYISRTVRSYVQRKSPSAGPSYNSYQICWMEWKWRWRRGTMMRSKATNTVWV